MKSRKTNTTRQSKIYDSFGIKANSIKIPALTDDTKNWYQQRFYLSTSDDLSLVTQSYSFRNKNVVTVAGAGDFPINFYYAGADNIQCFDISKQSCFFSELKVAALKKLNYKEFIEFFYPEKYWSRYPQEEKHYSYEIYPFDLGIFDELKNEISPQARRFLSLAFNPNHAGNYMRVTPDSGIILRRGFARAKKFSPYLKSKTNYKHAQEIVREKPCKFYPISIEEYFERFDKKCDYVYITNIFSDQLDKLFDFSSQLLSADKTQTIGATLVYPFAETDLVPELHKKEVRKRAGLSESMWEKMFFAKNNNSIIIDNLKIQIFKSVKRTYLELTIK